MGSLGVIVGLGLAVASKIFYVYVDPQVMAVDDALRFLLERSGSISAERVKQLIHSGQKQTAVTDITVPAVVLHIYDSLLGGAEVTA